MDDELQELRDNFFVGNFEKAMKTSEAIHASCDLTQLEKDAIYARCCLALSKMDALKSMQNSENPGQKAAALSAIIAKSPKENVRASAKEHLMTLVKDTQDLTATMLASIVIANEGSYTEAVNMAQSHQTLEMQALCVFFCLACNQPGMAERMLNDMSGSNDDAVAYRLARAAVKLAIGDPGEAYLTYCDLTAQFPAKDGDSESGSVMLQAAKAASNMQRGMFTEAIEDLNRALEVDPKNVDSLINMCSCATNLGRKEDFQKYYTTLSQTAPNHPYVQKSEGISQAFSRFRASIAAH